NAPEDAAECREERGDQRHAAMVARAAAGARLRPSGTACVVLSACRYDGSRGHPDERAEDGAVAAQPENPTLWPTSIRWPSRSRTYARISRPWSFGSVRKVAPLADQSR